MIEADESWSFVGSKGNVQWVWVARHAATRRVLAVVVSDRSEFAAECLWRSLPAEYREYAAFRTALPPAYRAVTPEGQHMPGGQGDGVTSHVEQFWLTVRQRSARFVRKTLPFSKCPKHHPGAHWFFNHQNNQSH